MRLLISGLAVLVIAVLIALFAKEDPGYIMINYRDWTIEASLVLTVTAILLCFIILYYLIRFLSTTRRMPGQLGAWRQNRQVRKARESLALGLQEIAEGQWENAEKHLLQHVTNSDAPLLNYLGAARAAQQLGGSARSDHYLSMAQKTTPKGEIAVALTQAELQLNNGQLEQAIAAVTRIRQLAPKNIPALKLALRIYTEIHDWERLLETLPVLRKRNAIKFEEHERLQLLAFAGLLKNAAKEGNTHELHDTWNRVPKDLKQNATLLLEYVRYLIDANDINQAEGLLYQALNKTWDNSFIYLYGIVEGSNPSRQLSHAENWLKTRPTDPLLLLTLGRLSMRNKLWGKARQYLEASLGAGPQAETCKELAALLEQMGEQEAAIEYYRQGLAIMPTVSNQLLASSKEPPLLSPNTR